MQYIITKELAERLKDHLAGAIDEVDEADALFQELQSLPVLESQPVAWECDAGIGLIRYVTDKKYKKFTPSIQKHYKPFTHPAPFTPITADIKMLTDDEAFDVECNSYANTAKAIQQAFCAKNNINLGAKK
jgi:hypothetical protein